jgi:signal transduction histidine kinase
VASHHLPANIAAAVRLKHVFELLQRILNVGAEIFGIRFSSNRDFRNGEEATPPVQQELGLDDQIDFRVVLLGPIRPLRPAIRDDVYRIGREALENALQHSRASRIEVEFEYAARRFRMVVRDNGGGIDRLVLDFRARERSGLRAMAELAATIGAKLTVWSRASSGTELELSVPNDIALESTRTSRT